MPNELTPVERLKRIKAYNDVKLLERKELRERLELLYNELEHLRGRFTDLEFMSRTLSEYYKEGREGNLKELSLLVSDAMTYILGKPYQVEITILKHGQYDYLDIKANGVPKKDLSGGEKQVLSLLLVSESVTNKTLILDETINSLDPFTQETVLNYLDSISQTYQIIMIELDDNLGIEYDFIVMKEG